MNLVKLEIPSHPAYLTTLRLVTASVAQKMGFDIESVEDLRVGVSEAINYLLSSNERFSILFDEDPKEGLVITIQAKMQEDASDKGRLHHMIMESLLDGVEDDPDGIVLIKHL